MDSVWSIPLVERSRGVPAQESDRQGLEQRIQGLRARLLDAENAFSRHQVGGSAPVGLDAIDGTLPGNGLRLGAVHEALTECADAPVALLALFAQRARLGARQGAIAWIGPEVFPSVWAMRTIGGDLGAHVLVDARRVEDRLWASDLALRCAAMSSVIVDGASFNASATRRLQLAAESTGALCLLARRASERGELSTSTTRWLIEPAISSHHSCARWTVRLLRCKGLRPTTHLSAWTVDIPHAPRDGRVSSVLRDGPSVPVATPIHPEQRDAKAHTLRFG